MKLEWKVLDKEVCFDGFFQLIKYRIKHSLFAGGWSQPIEREIFERGSAVGVLPYDAKLNKLLLVEQFRAGAMWHKDGPWMTEIIAGMIDNGEQPEDVATREAVEEAGIQLTNLRLMMDYMSSPGGTTEEIFLYMADADLSQAGGIYGLQHEGEDIRVQLCTPEDAFEMLANNSLSNAMTILALQWFKEHGDYPR